VKLKSQWSMFIKLKENENSGQPAPWLGAPTLFAIEAT
jgi:hypothetical protein